MPFIYSCVGVVCWFDETHIHVYNGYTLLAAARVEAGGERANGEE